MWKRLTNRTHKQVLPSYYEKTLNQNTNIHIQFNPLKKQEIPTPMEINYYYPMEIDYTYYFSLRTGKKEWIDYFGIIMRKNQQIYSNIEQMYLEDQNKLDRIAESFVSGTLHEKLSQIYSPYLKKYDSFQKQWIPAQVYSREKDDITYIIIGKFHSTGHAKLILNKMEVFMENFP